MKTNLLRGLIRNLSAGGLFTAVALISPGLSAEVQVPAIFGDHMVLQEGIKLPIWGTAQPGEAVTVTVDKETSVAKADSDGKWQVELPPIPENQNPVTVTVAGHNTLTFHDVLIGDVWLCSGQSNMQFNLGGAKGTFGGVHNADTVVPQASDPQLRLFIVSQKLAMDPATNVGGSWKVCTPESASLFSGVGYFFGRDLRKSLNRPIGLIGSYWGGTPAQGWTSLSGLGKDPELHEFVDTAAKIRAQFPQATADYPAKQAAYATTLATWKKEIGDPYTQALQSWSKASSAATAAGQPAPPKPELSQPMPHAPPSPDGGPGAPSNLYNGMIAPLQPFGIKGVIWYQGESNASQPIVYRTLFSRLIKDWREKWGEGDLPFLFVQLAAYKGGDVQNWPFLREAQLMTLALPNTGMASAVDIGDSQNIHPKDKEDVGHRLAAAAYHVAYGKDLVYSGPIFNSMKVAGNVATISFTQTGSGLTIGAAPWTAAGAKPLPTDKLIGFAICGTDQNWVPADAKIDGTTVTVSNAAVPAPVAVRYDWANAPEGNLYNKENLPASPFRTDDWPVPVPAKK